MNSIWRSWVLNYTHRYAVSSRILESIYKKMGFVSDPVGVISDGVNTEIFKPLARISEANKPATVNIGWAGNSQWGPKNSDHKGLKSVIEPAIEKLKTEGLSVEGVFCDRVEKWVEKEKMPEYYNSIDVYVCASLSEGTPNPVLEAMACGIPVLSTDVGIVRELFGTRQSSFVVKDRNSAVFLNKLRQLVTNPGLRHQLAEENLDSIRNWDWKMRIKPWRRFVLEALDSRQNPEVEEKQLAGLRETLGFAQKCSRFLPPEVLLDREKNVR